MRRFFTLLFAMATVIAVKATDYNATGTVAAYPEDWGEGYDPADCVFTDAGDVEVEVYEDYTIIRKWAGVEGYDLCIMHEAGEQDWGNVQSVCSVINGEIQEEVVNYGFYEVLTGREDCAKVLMAQPYTTGGTTYDYMFFSNYITDKAGMFVAQSMYLLDADGKYLMDETGDYLSGDYYCSWGDGEEGDEENGDDELNDGALYSNDAEVTAYPSDWGEGYDPADCVFTDATGVKVRVYEDYTIIKNWAGVEGYDLCIMHEAGEQDWGSVQSVCSVINGEIQEEVVNYGFYEVLTGREDCAKVLMAQPYTTGGTTYDYMFFSNYITDKAGLFVAQSMYLLDADGKYLMDETGDYLSGDYYCSWGEETEEAVLGDVDGDGAVTMSDANAVVNKYLGMDVDSFDADAADMDGDSTITMSDANAIVNKYLGAE